MKKLIKSRHFWFPLTVLIFSIGLLFNLAGFELLGKIFLYLYFVVFFIAYIFMAKFVWNGNKLAVREIKRIIKEKSAKQNDSTDEQIKK